MLTFCTVSTNSHLFKSYALADSIEKFGAKLYVLITDDINKSGIIDKPGNVELVSLSKIQNEHSEKVVDKLIQGAPDSSVEELIKSALNKL